ncbi:TROVE domain-containing protein [Pseudonocardia sp. DSM 110487]|uniref:TROVE domain-containing protein n=1 Tax=Pseudonocardia sp. DSM 110487 TaxID=2865833 RepID=UPI001C69CD28|nr:TROVE domain-containing protein [Pseudonocardia sp. DSM 110487]QYN38510.1 TROVE domain-containing protein [Pseudonocardia sp. DSM 110487]
MDPLTAVTTRQTPQTEPADARQKPNAAGGYAFALGDDARVHRFLVLGTDGGTYYTSERELTKDNAEVVLRAARERGEWLVAQVVAVSTAGRAPRQNPAIFALAAASALADDAGRKAAFAALPAVCRTGTHLFLFARYVEQFRGWGRGLRRAVAGWYLDRPVDDVAYQAVKYRQREGWSHRDLLRLAHPDTDDAARRDLFRWIVADEPAADVPPLVSAFVAAQTASIPELIELIGAHPLSWEMLPDTALGRPEVWRALVEKGMPQTALMRQLPRLTRLGVLDGDTRRTVVAQLADADRLGKARVHPVNVLVALRTYASGRSARGDGEWRPDRRVVDALDAAFYAAFGTVEPAGKRTLIALDVSGSMTAPASGLPISCREASAALALVTMATEPDVDVVGFTSASRGGWGGPTVLSELPISPRQRLDDAIRAVSNLPFGGTDCALPILWAQEQGKAYDSFQVYTDNETWAGSTHPHQALRRYREHSGIDARLVVVGMTASDVSISDPNDPGSLDVAGFDAAVPNLIADFSRGDV